MERKPASFVLALVLAAVGLIASPTPTVACSADDGWQQCDPTPDRQFQPGTKTRPADCTAEFRLPPELVTEEGIVLNSGYYDWVIRKIRLNSAGQPTWQIAQKIIQRPSKTLGVYYGTTVATYITCDDHTAWYAVTVNGSCPKDGFTLQRVNWPFDWQQLEAAVARNGR